MPEENQNRLADPTSPKGPPPQATKKSKPCFDDFFQILSHAVCDESSKDNLALVARILNKGFTGEVQSNQADKVFQLIQNYHAIDRLVVHLTSSLPKRSSGIARAMRNRLRTWSAEQIGFPVERPGEDRYFHLVNWILQGTPKQDSGETRHPAAWVRMAFACLTSERDPTVTIEVVHRLLAVLARTTTRAQSEPFRTDRQSFLREAGKLISAKKVNAGKVATALQFAHPLEEKAHRDQTELSQMRQQTEDVMQSSRSLKEENVGLQRDIDSALASEKELRRQLEEARMQLAQEKGRVVELEAHWRKTSEQNLARQRHQIGLDLEHDLQEARIALSSDSPNAGMALNRIRKAEDKLRKLDPSK